MKGAKLKADDFSPQASIANAMASGMLTREAARADRATTPLLHTCLALYQQAQEQGREDLDMVAVIRATDAGRPTSMPGDTPASSESQD